MNYKGNSELIRYLITEGDKSPTRTVCLGTHSSEFHGDDLLATAVLMRELIPLGYNPKVIRSRDVGYLQDNCAVIYDVGHGRYDHHDRAKVYYPNGIQMAACGKILNDVFDDADLLNGLRVRLFYAVEALDNGQELPPYMEPSKLAFVTAFNPTWEEPRDSRSFYIRFMKAVQLVGNIYERVLANVLSDLKARDFINSPETKFHFNGRFMELQKYCPCYEYAKLHEEFLGAIYPSEDQWTIRLSPNFRQKHATRVSFPTSWCGYHSPNKENPAEDLANFCPIKGVRFCHPAGFIMTCDTHASALEVCEYLLKGQE